MVERASALLCEIPPRLGIAFSKAKGVGLGFLFMCFPPLHIGFSFCGLSLFGLAYDENETFHSKKEALRVILFFSFLLITFMWMGVDLWVVLCAESICRIGALFSPFLISSTSIVSFSFSFLVFF